MPLNRRVALTLMAAVAVLTLAGTASPSVHARSHDRDRLPDRREAQELRRDVRERVQEHRERAQERRAVHRQEVREQRQQFDAAIKARLAEHHQTVARRVSDNLNRLNQHLGDQYERYLELLEKILGKVDQRSNRLAEQGADTAAVESAIASARTVIDEALAAVEDQRATEYAATLSGDQRIGEALRATVQELRADHRTVRQQSIARAREAVHNAFRSLREAERTFRRSASPTPASTTTPATSPSPTP